MLCYGYGYFDKNFRGCMILELVTALKQIVETLTQGGQSYEVGDACNVQPETPNNMNLLKNAVTCNCTLNYLNNYDYCHITSL